MRYGSVCSGIEAATVAWHPLGWVPAFFAEIDAFPSAILAHHYPGVPNLGDFTRIADDAGPVDLLVGGTPCQSFSVAGLRKGLGDERGVLALEYLRLAARLGARWLVWENVPGVLSSNGGRDFGAFLGGLVELGYGFAYRVLDAQYAGVPQRRRRVFVVGHLGDWRPAAAVLFERHSLQGHSPPSREAGEDATGSLEARTSAGGFPGTDGACEGHIVAAQATGDGCWRDGIGPLAVSDDNGTNQIVAHSLRGEGFDASEDGTGRGVPLVAHAFTCKDYGADAGELAPTLRAMSHDRSHANAGGQVAIAFAIGSHAGAADADVSNHSHASGGPVGSNISEELAYSLRSGRTQSVVATAPRRLTPRECERLQGFPDDYTLIRYRGKPAADGPRYKALGNSFAVPVVRWIGERIQAVEEILRQREVGDAA